MMDSEAANGSIASVGREIYGLNPTEWNSIVSTALRHTDFLESPKAQEILYASSFDLNELNRGNVTIYLVIPPLKIDRYFRLLRLWINSALEIKMQSFPKKKSRYSTLFLLDEMAQIGKMDSLYQAISVAAGYGVTIWGIVQNIGQLKHLYPDHKWEAFIQNTGVKQFFGVQDINTAEYVSKMVGRTTITVKQKTKGGSTSNTTSKEGGSFGWSRSVSVTESEIGRDLIMPNEVIGMDPSKMIMFTNTCSTPIFCDKLNYYMTTLNFIEGESEFFKKIQILNHSLIL